MSGFISLNLEGGKELEKKLLNLEKRVAKKIVKRGVRKGLRPTLAAAKSNVMSMMGGRRDGGGLDVWGKEVSMKQLLVKNLVLRAARKQRRGSYAMSVGVKGDVPEFIANSKSGTKYYIPSAIEYGHAFPGRGGGKNVPEDVPAIPFMRAASDANLKKAVPILRNEIVRGIGAISRGG